MQELLASFATPAPPPVRVGWRTRLEPEWTFDVDAIEHAARELGVTSPVVVGAVEYRRGRWGGMHRVERGEHRISVPRWQTPEEASRVVWHELSHAAQHDRGVKGGTKAVARAYGWGAYMADPREVEARDAEANHERLALVR